MKRKPPRRPFARPHHHTDHSPTSPTWHAFETEEAASREDRGRHRRLHATWRKRTLARDFGIRRRAASHLARGLNPERPSGGSLGSMRVMRSVRIQFHTAVREALLPYPDEELATATVIKATWMMSPEELMRTPASRIKNEFRSDLNRIGLTREPGPFFAVFEAEWNSTSGMFVGHFHVATTRQKAELLRGLKDFRGYGETSTGAPAVKVYRIKDRERQVTYIWKPFWSAAYVLDVNVRPKRTRSVRRIKEPFGSLALLWLDLQRPSDLVVVNGIPRGWHGLPRRWPPSHDRDD